MIEIQNHTSIDISTKKIEKICEKLCIDNIELTFLTNEEIQDINLKHRNINKITDVLSFPYEKIPHTPLGSILINLELAKHTATSLGHELEEEITLLFIHGFLHIIGMDHENDSGEMREKELELMKEFNLPKSLIERTL